MKESKYSGKKKIPLGIKIISIFYYVVTGLLLLSLIGALFQPKPLLSLLGLESVLLVIIGLLVIASISFFIGRGLWKGQKWSRWVSISLAILAILSAISLFIRGSTSLEYVNASVNLVINGFIAGYLLFYEVAKKYFK